MSLVKTDKGRNAMLNRDLVHAVRYIYRKSGSSFGARVYERLCETIPEVYLSEMEHLAVELAELQ